MSKQSEKVLNHIREVCEVGAEFTARDLKIPDIKLHSLQNALWALSKKGFLDKPRGKGSRGRYVLRGRKAPAKTTRTPTIGDPEMVVIEHLLDAMAAAEPILKKWSRVHEALKGI